MIIDIALVAIVAGVAWVVAGEGPWGAALTFLAVLFSGLLAMNFFEPLANFLEDQFADFGPYADFVSLVGLFALFTFLSRLATDYLSPSSIELEGPVYQFSRWVFSLPAGYITMALFLTALHTAPLPREFLGFTPERRNLFGVAAPDRQWLGFTQHVSEKIFRGSQVFDLPQYKPPGMKDENVWPSFAIRYATRRDQYAGAAAPAAPTLVAPGKPGAPPAAAGTPSQSTGF